MSAAFVYMKGGSIIPPSAVIIAGISAFLITGGGNVLNDYFDYEIDKINKKERPIASGRVSRSDALMLSVVLFLVGLALAKCINILPCLLLAAMNAIILIIYAKYSKKLLLVSNMSISYLVASIFLFGVFSASHTVDPVTGPDTSLSSSLVSILGILDMPEIKIVSILSICAFFMTFSREIIKDIEDISGDEHNYAITLPIKIGVKNSKKIATAFTVFAVLFSFSLFILKPPDFNLIIYGLFILIADILFLTSITKEPSVSQRVIVGGMVVSLVAFFLGNLMSAIL